MKTDGVWLFLVEATRTYLCGSVEREYFGPFDDVYSADTFIDEDLEFDDRNTEIICVKNQHLGYYDATRSV